MRHLLALIVAIIGLLSACWHQVVDPVDPPPTTAVPTTTAPTTTTAPPTTTTTTVPARPPTVEELLARDEVLDIAHAGGDQDHPHSTMYAFSESVKEGADVLEMDIWATADGEVVVTHDAVTTQTTPESLVVSETDLATLQALDAAYWFSPTCWPCRDLPDEDYVFRGVRTGEVEPPTGYSPEDFRIITLAELDAAFPTVPFDIEIKGSGDEGLRNARALADELATLDREDSTVVVSFESDVIAEFHDVAPEVATSPGVSELLAFAGGTPLADHHAVVQVPPSYGSIDVLTASNLEAFAEAGVAVWVWPNDAATQETEDFYRYLVDLGVDGIIAGRPALAREVIG